MYYYFYGELVYLDSACAAIDCGGVAYKLTVSANTANALAEKKGAKVKLFSNMQVREDSMELSGFLSEEELQAFKL
ncbi:MAG: Holliday junction branch migration protein RuvA, partial [Clostridia bacterium]|nr:Holliday junction branch migration protein RuvA [Clostridia bacterium]